MTQRKRVFVESDNCARFVCPECGTIHTIRATSQFRSSTPVRTRVVCDCGARHVVYVERRASGRKDVEIGGWFSVNGDGVKRQMTVRNLSRSGLLFEPQEVVDVGVGDDVFVEFELVNAVITPVVKGACVRRLAGAAVGAEYAAGADGSTYDPVYDLALALYSPVSDQRLP